MTDALSDLNISEHASATVHRLNMRFGFFALVSFAFARRAPREFDTTPFPHTSTTVRQSYEEISLDDAQREFYVM